MENIFFVFLHVTELVCTTERREITMTSIMGSQKHNEAWLASILSFLLFKLESVQKIKYALYKNCTISNKEE